MSLDFRKLQRIAQVADSGYGSGDAAFSLPSNGAVGYEAMPADFDGVTLPYVAQYISGATGEYEIGRGIFTIASRTWARTTIDKSSNSDAKVDFNGAPTVFFDFTGLWWYWLDSFLNVTGSSGSVGVARTALGLAIGTDVLAEQTIGIADDNLLEVDGTPNSAEYARFTANGIEGRTEAEFKTDYNLEDGDINTLAAAQVTTANVTSAGALMDSEVDADIKTLSLPASTTISAFGASIIDDADEAAFKATTNLEDSDINTLVNARIAALQASGDLPPDPSALVEGDMIAVNALGKYAKVG